MVSRGEGAPGRKCGVCRDPPCLAKSKLLPRVSLPPPAAAVILVRRRLRRGGGGLWRTQQSVAVSAIRRYYGSLAAPPMQRHARSPQRNLHERPSFSARNGESAPSRGCVSRGNGLTRGRLRPPPPLGRRQSTHHARTPSGTAHAAQDSVFQRVLHRATCQCGYPNELRTGRSGARRGPGKLVRPGGIVMAPAPMVSGRSWPARDRRWAAGRRSTWHGPAAASGPKTHKPRPLSRSK